MIRYSVAKRIEPYTGPSLVAARLAEAPGEPVWFDTRREAERALRKLASVNPVFSWTGNVVERDIP